MDYMWILAVLSAYLLGSCSWAVWIGKWFYGTDVREHGSGNAGATNTFRVLGYGPGVVVLILDALKGFLAVYLGHLSGRVPAGTDFQIVLGMVSVVGHIFPLYTGFRGGKGIATLLGVVLALHLFGALLALGTFVVFLFITRYVSLSSIAAAFSFPCWILLEFREMSVSLIIFSLACVVLILITHQKNIERLLRREENKVKLFR